MKTTIELPDDLFLQAKRFALERGTTLKALVENGLRNALAQPELHRAAPYRLPVITTMSAPLAGHQHINEVIDQMRNEQLDQLLRP